MTTSFTRTRFTWLGYLMMMFFGMGVALPAPIIPFIGEQLGLNYTQMGNHFAMLALGNLTSGMIGDRLAARWGNRSIAWASVLLGTLSTFGLVSGNSLWMTLPSAFLVGLGSGGAALLATASLADEHPQQPQQARALTESNVLAGTGVALTPLIVGGLEQVGVGWQGIAGMFVVMLLVMAVFFGRVAFPKSQTEVAQQANPSASTSRKLPPLFWMFGSVIFLVIAIEWLIISWSPDFLSTVQGFSLGTAALLGSAYGWSIVIGRVIGGWLLERIRPERLLFGSYVLLLGLFPLYLYAPHPYISVAALMCLGLVTANQFPLTLAAAMSAGGEQTNRASAGVSILGGTATFTLPQTVGVLSDFVGIQMAFNAVIVLALIALVLMVLATRMRTRTLAAAS